MERLNKSSQLSQTQEAGVLSRDLLHEMETEELPIERHLMKAKRLARLLKDADAQAWLNYEMCGYPGGFVLNSIGSCRKYAEQGGRFTTDGKYWPSSLPAIEAYIFTNKNSLGSSVSPKTLPNVKNYMESGAVKDVINHQNQVLNNAHNAYVKNITLFSSLKSAIHSYVTDSYIAIELGDFAQSIFEEARESVERFVRANCPIAAEKLLAITSRIQENNGEARSSALTSCRRLLMDVADTVFPAQEGDWLDSSGKKRKVGKENYKNRISAFFDSAKMSGSSESIITSELEHLVARLDAVYENSCKGVHDDVSTSEARLAVISTYLVIAEVARIYESQRK